MGEVFLAGDDAGHVVALKVLHPQFTTDPLFRARFAREAEAARRVESRFVAALIDADCEGDRPWLASEFIEGPSLRAQIEGQGPLAGPQAAELAAALAEGLAAIHAAGIVHRDLTPSNVIMGVDGPRIVDFGIAQLGDLTALTQAGAVMGTPSWIAPEMYRGSETGPAADVWAWACTVVFAMTGRPAVTGQTPQAVMANALAGTVDLAWVPEPLLAPIRQSLNPDPSMRPTAKDLSAILSSTRAGIAVTVAESPPTRFSPPAPPLPARSARRPLAVLGVAAIIILSAVAAAVIVTNKSSQHGAQASPPTTAHGTSVGTSLQSSETTAPQTSASTVLAPPTTLTPALQYDGAIRKVNQLGFTPTQHVGFDVPGSLQAVLGYPNGSIDGSANQVFFFIGGKYLGTDSTSVSYRATLNWNDPTTVAVDYALYHQSDPMCCPTAGSVTVRYQWNGTRVIDLDPIPPVDGDPHR